MKDEIDHPIPLVAEQASAIIAADESQQRRIGRPIPPAPPLSGPTRLALWLLFLVGLAQAIYQFVIGNAGIGAGVLVSVCAAAVFRWCVADGARLRRWENPRYRALYLDTTERIAQNEKRPADSSGN